MRQNLTRREASHLSQVRSNLQKAGFLGSWWRRGVVDIPEPISEMCTKEVLVMRFLEGDNLVDGIRALGERAARRQGFTLDDLKRDMLAKFEREGADSASVSELFRTFKLPRRRLRDAVPPRRPQRGRMKVYAPCEGAAAVSRRCRSTQATRSRTAGRLRL